MRPSSLSLTFLLFAFAACTPAHRAADAGPDTVRPGICGDLYVNADVDEQCDDGNTEDGDGCDSSCRFEIPELCGNTVLDDGEDCDDGANEAGDGCGPGCWIEACGNTYLDPGEACEDANTVGGDGCSADCKSDETCGNGIKDPNEICDDGNGDDTDECPASCEPATCGDGFVHSGVESCDDGNEVANDGCTECILDSCGDGNDDEGEECDLGAGNGLAGTTCFKNCISTEIVSSDVITSELDPYQLIDAFPHFVDVADFNGDGRPDLLIGDEDNGTSATATGLGDGRMWPVLHNFSSVGAIRRVQVADVNGDGLPDALSVGSSDALSVMLGDGTAFARPTNFSTLLDIGGDNPFDLAVADLTGDDILDVVTVHSTSNDAIIMVGDGDGNFTATTRLATQVAEDGTTPQAIAVGDVTGDGNIDVVTANRTTDDVSLFAGLGGGAYAAAQIFTTRVGAGGDNPIDITITDVTNDGVADVLVACSTSADVVVLAAQAGSLAAPQSFTVRQGDDKGINPNRLFVTDVTQDGIKDIVTANSSSSDVSVLAGLGPGVAFGSPSIFSVNTAELEGSTRQTFDISVADMNGDSRPDLIALNSSTRDASVFLGDGESGFGDPRAFRIQTSLDTGVPRAMTVADINGDGLPDMVSGGSSVTVLAGLGDGLLATPQHNFNYAGRRMAAVDLNSDGLLDYVASNGSQILSFLQGFNGELRHTFTASNTTALHIAVGEFTGDSAPDVAASGSVNMSLLANNNDGTGRVTSIQNTNIGVNVHDCVLADINGDSTLDLLMPSFNSDGVFISTGTGTGNFAAPVSVASSAGSSGQNPVALAVADLNGDGLNDMITANSGSNDLSVLLGEGSGVFEDPSIVPTVFGADAANVQSVAVGDFNNDGILDLAAANPNRDTVSVMLGFGSGVFAAPQTFEVIGLPFSIAVADFDGDGIDDIAAVSREASTITTLNGFEHP